MKNTHVGFNLQWMYNTHNFLEPLKPDLKLLDFLSSEGFTFIRLPLNYWFWIKNFNYQKPNEKRLNLIESYVDSCIERGFHVSLNVHRAPGYCINGAELERHNLWKDTQA